MDAAIRQACDRGVKLWGTCAGAILLARENVGETPFFGLIDITVNRNAVPFDPRPPRVTSGLRIGTPALATRGFGVEEFTEVADIIATALMAGAAGKADDELLAGLKARVHALTEAFPLYPGLAQ